jgi:hypothetical protein
MVSRTEFPMEPWWFAAGKTVLLTLREEQELTRLVSPVFRSSVRWTSPSQNLQPRFRMVRSVSPQSEQCGDWEGM